MAVSRSGPVLELAGEYVASLDEYIYRGGMQGYEKLSTAQPQEVLGQLRASALSDFGPQGTPLHLRWQQLLQGRFETIVADLRRVDPRHEAPGLVAGNCPWLVLEGLAAAWRLAPEAVGVRVLLDEGLGELRPRLLEAAGEMARAHPELNEMELEVVVDPGVYGVAGQGVMWCGWEGWCWVGLSLARGGQWAAAEGSCGVGGTRLLTVGGMVANPGVVEVPAGASIREVLEAAGGPGEGWEKGVVVLDGGAGGVAGAEQVGVSLAPEAMVAAELNPAPGTVWVMGEGSCVVDITRKALVRLASAGGVGPQARALCWHAVRLCTQIGLRSASGEQLELLEEIAWQLKRLEVPSAWTLGSSLKHFGSHWHEHISGAKCAVFDPQLPHVAPCQNACPAGIDIPSFVALVGQGRYREAVEVIRRDNPLVYICGLVCPAPCEKACLRGLMDEPVSIRVLKAVAARHALEEGGYPVAERAPATGKRVAVVGAGPAGLTCAYFLALAGHEVVVFEAQDVVGGTTYMGIPAYRLPREVIDADVQAIKAAGVEIRTGMALGRDFTLEGLHEELGFDAVFLGIGAHEGYRLGIPGEDEHPDQVLDAITFLRAVALGKQGKPAEEVVVVGGGNAAMDAARTCVRLGCKKVTIAYRRTRKEMPAHEEEITDAMAEGVEFAFLTVPKEVVAEGGKVVGLKCLRAELGPPDASGRRRPVPVEGSDFVIPAGAIIAAISQRPDLGCLGRLGQDPKFCAKTILADPVTGQTAYPWLFAGGDAVTGPATVVEAVGAGKRAAMAMDAYLRGKKDLAVWVQPPEPRASVEPIPTTGQHKTMTMRAQIPKLPPAERRKGFMQAELPLPDDKAAAEAVRCLRCDICIGCGLCQSACAETGPRAIRLVQAPGQRMAFTDLTGPASRCKGCGACAAVCPTGAITTHDEGDVRRVVFVGAVLAELPLARCSACGRPITTRAQLEQLSERLQAQGAPDSPSLARSLCPDCARAARARELVSPPGTL